MIRIITIEREYGSGASEIARELAQQPQWKLWDQKDAESMVDNVDRERAAFIKRYFHVEWPNLPVYHAMLNTASGSEAVIRAMLSFMNGH